MSPMRASENEPLPFQAVERLVERAVLDPEAPAGLVLEPGRDLEPVHGAPGQRLEDEDVEGALEEGQGSGGGSGSQQSLH